MIGKNNRLNHDFQILHFLVGSCHTPDGAYSLLCDLREGRSDALKAVKASKLREQAKTIRAQRKISSSDPAEQLEGQADLAEIQSHAETTANNIAAAEQELAFIQTCIDKLQSMRKYSDLPDSQAHEACQQEEWRLELLYRAENFLLTQGTIPHDHFATMRQHPAFLTDILPALEQIKINVAQGNAMPILQSQNTLRGFLLDSDNSYGQLS